MQNIKDNLGLHRSTRNKWLFGVCGGIAEKFDISPKLVRLLFVLVPALPGGLAIPPVLVLYVILGLILPKDTEKDGAYY